MPNQNDVAWMEAEYEHAKQAAEATIIDLLETLDQELAEDVGLALLFLLDVPLRAPAPKH